MQSRFDTGLISQGVNRRIFTQNVFLAYMQTALEENKIFVQFHCLSSYQNNKFSFVIGSMSVKLVAQIELCQ